MPRRVALVRRTFDDPDFMSSIDTADEAPQVTDYRDDIQAASAALRNTIAETEGPLPPAWVVEFMLRSWRRYLVLVHHDNGPSSAAWARAIDCTRRLLQSIVPTESPEKRAQLVRELPRLVTDVKIAIDKAQVEAQERDTFLDQLKQLHMSLLKLEHMPADAGTDFSDTVTMDVRDPRYRALLDRLDGADSVEHIEM